MDISVISIFTSIQSETDSSLRSKRFSSNRLCQRFLTSEPPQAPKPQGPKVGGQHSIDCGPFFFKLATDVPSYAYRMCGRFEKHKPRP